MKVLDREKNRQKMNDAEKRMKHRESRKTCFINTVRIMEDYWSLEMIRAVLLP